MAFPNLRMRNIFGPQMVGNDLPQQGGIMGNQPFQMPQGPSPFQNISFGPTNVPIPPPDSPDFDVQGRMNQLYTPEHVASDRFNQLASQYPQYQEPGHLRRIGGSILGALTDLGINFGGNKAGVQGRWVYDEATGKNKWREDVGNWKEQIGPAQQAANLERYSNANERQLAHQTVSDEISARRQKATEQNQTEQNRIRDLRAKAYDFKSRNPDAKIVVRRGGNVLAINPQTGATIRDFGPSGLMSEDDKLDLEQLNALERIGATGEEARKTEDTRQTGREALQTQKGWTISTIPDPSDPTKQIGVRINGDTGEVQPIQLGGQNVGPIAKPSSTGGRPESSSNKLVGEFERAQRLKATNPELGAFIQLNPTNKTFTIAKSKPASSFAGYQISGSGPNDSQRKQLEQEIYGGPTQGTSFPQSDTPNAGRGGGPGRGGQPRFTSQNPPQAPPGWKYVPKPGGGWTAVKQ